MCVREREYSGSTRRMAELGMSCFNVYEISLNDVFGSVTSENILAVVFEAMG